MYACMRVPGAHGSLKELPDAMAVVREDCELHVVLETEPKFPTRVMTAINTEPTLQSPNFFLEMKFKFLNHS